jgi:short-subunit dehydrogenase
VESSELRTSVFVGGSSGIGRHLAQRAADRGENVFITSRDSPKANAVATEIGGKTTGLAIDLTQPHTIADALMAVIEVDHLVISAVPQ